MDKIGIMPGTGARQVGSSGAKAERRGHRGTSLRGAGGKKEPAQ